MATALSMIILSVMAFDRYRHIIKIIDGLSNQTTTKMYRLAALFCWIYSYIITIPMFIFMHYDKEQKRCKIR